MSDTDRENRIPIRMTTKGRSRNTPVEVPTRKDRVVSVSLTRARVSPTDHLRRWLKGSLNKCAYKCVFGFISRVGRKHGVKHSNHTPGSNTLFNISKDTGLSLRFSVE